MRRAVLLLIERNSLLGGKYLTENNRLEIPWWEKYTLTIQEAAKYFRIGDKKLKKFVDEHEDAQFILWNGNRAQIKRKMFEKYIDENMTVI
jgi:hypothetical protein